MTQKETEEMLIKWAKELSPKECQQMTYPELNWEDGYVYGYQHALRNEKVSEISYDAEELACVKQWLDKIEAPVNGEKGKLSVIGRIQAVMQKMQEELQQADLRKDMSWMAYKLIKDELKK